MHAMAKYDTNCHHADEKMTYTNSLFEILSERCYSGLVA